MLCNGGALFGGVVDGQQLLKNARDPGRVDTEGVDDGGNAPHKNAGVPKIARLFQVTLRGGEIGLFAEAVDGIDIALARGGIAEVGLDVAIAGGGVLRVNAEGDDGVGFGGELNALTDALRESGSVAHIVIGGRNNECGTGIALFDAPCGVADAGGGAAHAGFEQHVVARHVGELFGDNFGIALGGDHPNVFGRNNAVETVDGELQHRATATEYIEELFRASFAAHGPESTADAAGHNDKMGVRSHGEEGM